MYISNPKLTFTYRLFYLIICGTGLLMHYSPDNAKANMKMLSYFTIQMNLLCFILFAFLLQYTYRELKATAPAEREQLRKKLSTFRGMVLVSIIIVFLAYNFVLKNTGFSMARGCPTTITAKDIFVHYLVPIMTFLDWLLFEPKGQFQYADPFLWLFLPICYYCIINIKTVFHTCSYPYYFIDIDQLGLHTVLNNAFLFVLVCLVIGYGITLFDRLLLLIYRKIYQKAAT